jgi:uncharacterized membrane protein YeaQ/YmgE (transglycosylase-associated protein family)
MSIIGWIILGLIAGFIANKIVEGSGQGFFLNIALGIVGALVGGFIYAQVLGGPGVTGEQAILGSSSGISFIALPGSGL